MTELRVILCMLALAMAPYAHATGAFQTVRASEAGVQPDSDLMKGGGTDATVAARQTAADDLTRPIRESPDGHFLVQPDGAPFFWLGDTAWELFHRLTREETERYLEDRASKGFNVIQAVATGELDYPGLRTPNRYGDVPFIDADPMRPNPGYFDHVDWVIECAARHGIRMAILPVWGSTLVSSGQPPAFHAGNAEGYGRWLGERYRGEGVTWVLGGDVNPIAQRYVGKSNERVAYPSVIDYRPVYDAMAKGIVSAQGNDAFITYHPTAGSPSGTAIPRMSLYFGDRDWLDLSMLQSSHAAPKPAKHEGGNYTKGFFAWSATFNYLPILAESQALPPRPVIDAEPRYEDHPMVTDFKQEEKQFWRAHHVRQALYQAVFAGAAGHTYGHFTVWDFYDPHRTGQPAAGYVEKLFEQYERVPWQQALDAPGARQMQYAKALMLSRPYFTRIPDSSLIVGDPGEGEQHIGATRDRSGAYAMVYLPQGQPIAIDFKKLSGASVIGWWFDPRTGHTSRIDTVLLTNQTQRFVPPTSGDDQDWVLVIDDAAKRFPAPGGKLP